MNRFDAVIIGGGLAGSAAGIRLAQKKWRVLILEKHKETKKVCGEFLSPSVWPVLKELGAADAVYSLGGTQIRTVSFSGQNGTAAGTKLPGQDQDFPFGYGISRRSLDACLLDQARNAGCEILCPAEVKSIRKTAGAFSVETSVLATWPKLLIESKLVLNASGKSNRFSCDPESEKQTGKIGFKSHFDGPPLDGEIRLFFFRGGYFGLAGIEKGEINLCGIIDKKWLKKYGADFDFLLRETAKQNAQFKTWFESASRKTDWITCASLVHGKNPPSQNGFFHAGDSACFLEPFMGQGMTMALAGGLLLAETLPLTPPSSAEIPLLQNRHQKELAVLYRSRLSIGNIFQRLAMSGMSASLLIRFLALFPAAFQFGVKKSSELDLPSSRELAHAV